MYRKIIIILFLFGISSCTALQHTDNGYFVMRDGEKIPVKGRVIMTHNRVDVNNQEMNYYFYTNDIKIIHLEFK